MHIQIQKNTGFKVTVSNLNLIPNSKTTSCVLFRIAYISHIGFNTDKTGIVNGERDKERFDSCVYE